MLILADQVERFRSVSMEQGRFELDPAQYDAAAHMAWDAMLNKTGATLDLITDPEIYHIFDSGLSAGVCMISPRYGKSNNELVGETIPNNGRRTSGTGTETIYRGAGCPNTFPGGISN